MNDIDLMCKEFEAYLFKVAEAELDKVTKETEQALKKNVEKNTYRAYKPLQYNRSYQLKNKLKIIEGNNFERFVTWQGLDYKSVVNGDDTSNFVPKWIDKGHSDGKGKGMFHNYPARNFVEETVDEINKKYGYEVVRKYDNSK